MPFGFHYDLLKQPFSAAISPFIETAQLIKVHSGAAVMTENDSFFISVSAGSFFKKRAWGKHLAVAREVWIQFQVDGIGYARNLPWTLIYVPAKCVLILPKGISV